MFAIFCHIKNITLNSELTGGIVNNLPEKAEVGAEAKVRATLAGMIRATRLLIRRW